MNKKADTIRQLLYSRGLNSDFGYVWVFDDHNDYAFQPWATRWATLRRNCHVVRAILRQLTCWHPQWVHNGSGKERLTLDEAYKWKGKPLSDIEDRETLPMVRHNWSCSRCRRISFRYTPDWSEDARSENEAAMYRGIERKYGPQFNSDGSAFRPTMIANSERGTPRRSLLHVTFES